MTPAEIKTKLEDLNAVVKDIDSDNKTDDSRELIILHLAVMVELVNKLDDIREVLVDRLPIP